MQFRIAMVVVVASACSADAPRGWEEYEDAADQPAGGKADTMVGPLVITEIGDAFVELRNDGRAPVDLDGWYLSFSYRRVRLSARDGRPSVVPPGGLALIVDADTPVPARAPAWLPVADTSGDIEELLAYSKSLILRDGGKLIADRADARADAVAGVSVERRLKTRWEPSASGGTPGARNTADDRGAITARFAVPHWQAHNELPYELAAFIDGAERTIDAALYQIDHPVVVQALVAAAERGVAVRLATDSHHLDDPAYADGYEALRAAGIPVVGDGRDGRQHNKFVVRDGATVWTGSYNPLIDELGKHVVADNVVILESRALAAIHVAELDQMMAGAFGPHKAPSAEHEVHLDGARVEVYFSPEDAPRDAILRELRRARGSIYFSQFAFYEREMGAVMVERAAAGVDVRGVFDQTSASSISQWKPLADAGLDVRRPYFDSMLHHKFVIVDYGGADPVVITGSYNLTGKADTNNDESVVIIHDPAIARAYYEVWRRTYDACSGPNTDTDGLAALAITEVCAGCPEPFVELANLDGAAVTLDGLALRTRDGGAWALAGELAAGGRVAVDASIDLDDALVIVDGARRVVATFDGPGYPGPGRSWERADVGAGDLDAVWTPSAAAGGTPGR